jgi:FG-GAP repeat protein
MSTFRLFRVGLLLACVMGTSAVAQVCTPTELLKLLPDGGDSFANFGKATDIAGDVAVVGQFRRDTGGLSDSGTAFVFEFDGLTWVRTAELTRPDLAGGDFFGAAVATDGTTIVVGAPFRAIDGTNQAGSAYVYRDLGAGWVLIDTLRAPTVSPGDQFGSAVDVQGGIVVVGAFSDRLGSDSEAGSVFVFGETVNGFEEAAFLQVPTASFRAHVGQSVAIDNGVIVAGAADENGGSGDRGGAAYVWVFDGGWQLAQKLEPTDPQSLTDFGQSVDIRGGTIVVGDPSHSVTGASSGGQIYVYRPDGSGLWAAEAAITPAGVQFNDAFGNEVALADADTIVVGASFDDDLGPQSGAAFVFKFDGASWVQSGPFFSSDDASGDNFGSSVGADGDRAIIGALGNDDFASQSGAAYMFDLGCAAICVPDFTGEGDLDFFDIQAFLQAFSAMDQSADLVDDDVFDFFDVQAFLQAFTAGCP